MGGHAGWIGCLAGVVAHMAKLQSFDGQHRVKVIESQDFDLGIIVNPTLTQRYPILQPEYGEGGITLGHGASNCHTLTTLQQSRGSERDNLWGH